MSMPPQKASALSITSSFMWWLASSGCELSHLIVICGSTHQRIIRKKVVPRPGTLISPSSQARM
jgi:hypothetical protein